MSDEEKTTKERIYTWWHRLKRRISPSKDYLEAYVDKQIKLISEAEDYQEWMMRGTWEEMDKKRDEEEDPEKRLFEANTDALLEAVQKRSIVLLYKSSKRLERLTQRLFLVTILLLLITILAIIFAGKVV
ncbi:MAG: hypothetical protein JRN44_02400 [Nitrososphaerota archaeon]|jgi:myo-inositol-1-phosphate synthase|nr:hypothetical protein [Nitrososphaerota archaeon]MDG6920726.1 hypothetical protein [Nitrososphaerota archaeon]MDG6947357.1 hypothetical protein [Nitrososphaerota archaeon]